MILDYAIYKVKSPSEKTNEFFRLERSLEGVESKQVKTFLRDLFSDQSQDFYLRKRALQLLAYLSLINRIKPESVIATILDIDETENEFIVGSGIKIASTFIHLFKASIVSWAQGLALSNNMEIRSEAFLLLGKNHLFEGLLASNTCEFITNLEEAKSYFDRSVSEIENRIDASMLSEVALFLLKVKTQTNYPLSEVYLRLQSKLWEFIRLSTHEADSLFFVNFCHPISVLHQIALTTPDNWIDFRAELNTVLQELLKIEIRSVTKGLVQEGILDSYTLAIKEQLIMGLLATKLGSHIARLKRMKDEMLVETTEQMNLLDELLEYLMSASDKKKDLSNTTEIVSRLHGAFPLIPLETITQDIRAIDLADPVSVSRIFEQYAFRYRQIEPRELETGYQQGDEIHKMIVQKIRGYLPNYDQGKFFEFMLVLRDVINYFVGASRASIRRMPFLFKSRALEVELQNSMLTFFNISKRADQYSPEVVEAADGGRVDILFRGNRLQVPIELKKSKLILDWDTVKKNYVSQAQTYAHTRDQLAFFVVLDVSKKSPAKPSPDIRELFKVIHLDTEHKLDAEFPDYVICFIIPANKISPHERSTYK